MILPICFILFELCIIRRIYIIKRSYHINKTAVLLLLSFFYLSCNSQKLKRKNAETSNSAQTDNSSADFVRAALEKSKLIVSEEPEPEPEPEINSSFLSCDDHLNQEESNIDAHESILIYQNSHYSLCHILYHIAKKKTAILQFTKENCDACTDKIKFINWAKDRSLYKDELAHFIFVKDSNSQQFNDIKQLITTEALNAFLITDSDYVLKSQFDKNVAADIETNLFAINSRLKWDFHEVKNQDYLNIIQTAEDLLLESTPELLKQPKEAPQIWTGSAFKANGYINIDSITLDHEGSADE